MPGIDPLFGVTWKVDKAKSKFSTSWSPDEETRLYEEIPGGYKLTVVGKDHGKSYSWHYWARYDGKDYPVIGRPDVDAIETYRVNDRLTIGFFKKDGEPCGPYARSISLDGTTLTVQMVGRNPHGEIYFDVLKYTRKLVPAKRV